MRKINKRIFRNLLEHKGQYIAITLLIAIGIMIFLAFDMAVYNLDSTIKTYYKEYGLADIYVYGNHSKDMLKDVLATDGIETAEARGEYEGRAIFASDEAKLKILSLTKGINQLYLADGTKDIGENDLLLFYKFAKARKIKTGDNITVRLEGKDYSLHVKGLVYSPEFIYLSESEKEMLPMPADYGVAYLSDPLMKKVYGEQYENQMIAQVNKETKTEDIKNTLQQIAINHSSYPAIVLAKEDQFAYRAAEEEIKGEIAMSQSMPVIFLIIAAIVMTVLVSRTVENDRTEIGILKAIGYSKKEVLNSYIKLTLITGSVGAILGMITGGLVSYEFTKVYTLMFEVPILVYNFDEKYLIIAVAIAIGLSTLAGFLGARKTLKILPQESMRPTAPVMGKSMFFDKLKWYKKLKFTNKMVLRNMVRNRKRVLLVILGVAISFALLLMPVAFYSLMNRMFVEQYTKVQRMDYDIKFDQVVTGQRVDEVLKHVKGYGEGYLEMPVQVEFEKENATLSIIGVNSDSKIYHLEDMEGNSITTGDGFYISEGFAHSHNIKKGDSLQIKSLSQKDIHFEVIVTAIVDQKLGSNGYMSLNSLREHIKAVNMDHYTGVYVQGEIDQTAIEKILGVKSIFSTQKIIDTYKEFTDIIFFGLGMLVLFGGVIAFVIIYIISLMGINERKSEFSSLRVLGFSKEEIFHMISRENILASIIGMLLGVPLGIWLINIVADSFTNDLYSMSMNYSVDMFLFAAFFTVIFIIIGQRLTKRKINKLDFIEALKVRMS